MKKNRFSEEQVVTIVRESRAHGVAETARKHGVSEQTRYLWRRRYGGMEKSQVLEMKRLRHENARLKKLLAERDLDIEVLKEINAKKW
ncbi:MAG: transposase [Bacillota bacterium]